MGGARCVSASSHGRFVFRTHQRAAGHSAAQPQGRLLFGFIVAPAPGLSRRPRCPNQTRLLAACSLGRFLSRHPVGIRLAFPVTRDAASQRVCAAFPATFRRLPAAVLLLPSRHPGDQESRGWRGSVSCLPPAARQPGDPLWPFPTARVHFLNVRCWVGGSCLDSHSLSLQRHRLLPCSVPVHGEVGPSPPTAKCRPFLCGVTVTGTVHRVHLLPRQGPGLPPAYGNVEPGEGLAHSRFSINS